MISKLRFSTILVMLSWLVPACVTINVYFPEAAAKDAADRIINKVYGSESADPKKPASDLPKPEKEPSSCAPSSPVSLIIDFIVLPVYAEVNIDISSPIIQALSNQMAKRHKQLLPFYEKGAIGLTKQASIVLRDPNQVPLKSRNEIKKLIKEENQDRSDLYREIATANGHPDWEEDIQKTFAKRWIDRAAKGWWYQDEQGEWQQR